MPLYKVKLSGNAWVTNTYRIEAESEQEAIEKAMTGDHESTDEEVVNQRDMYAEAFLIAQEPVNKVRAKGASRGPCASPAKRDRAGEKEGGRA